MIRHIVLTKFKHGVPEGKIEELYAEFAALVAELPGACGFTGGRSESPEQIERGYMHGFVIDFDSWDALQNYTDNDDHKTLGGRLVADAEGGIDGILVLDLDVQTWSNSIRRCPNRLPASGSGSWVWRLKYF